MAYAGAAKGSSMLLLRQGATYRTAAKAVANRNALKTGFNLGMEKGKMTMDFAMKKYKGNFTDIIKASGRTATGKENAIFGIKHSWNMVGAESLINGGYGLQESLNDSEKQQSCE